MTNPIGWCDRTVNPTVGCTRGCPYCYAHKQATRVAAMTAAASGKPICEKCQTFTPHFHPERLRQVRSGGRKRVFIGSMGDLWDPGVNQAWRNAIWSAVRHNVQHYAQGGANTYLVLTKWAHVITQTDTDWFEECPHLWVGLSVDGLVPSLRPWLNLCNAVPAGSRFISLEPASPDGVFDLRAILSMDSKDHPDWLIVGPETPRYKHLGDPGEAQIVELISEARGLGIPVWAKASCVLAWPDVVGWSELPATMRYTEAQL